MNSLLATSYSERYRNRRHSNRSAFERFKGRFIKNGGVNYKKRLYKLPILNVFTQLNVLGAVIEDLRSS